MHVIFSKSNTLILIISKTADEKLILDNHDPVIHEEKEMKIYQTNKQSQDANTGYQQLSTTEYIKWIMNTVK